MPTAIAYHGVFYVSNLGTFDTDQLNKQSIFQITPSGRFHVVATGLSKVLGLAFDRRGRMYALEDLVFNNRPRPSTLHWPADPRLTRWQGRGDRYWRQPVLPNGHDLWTGWRPVCLQHGLRAAFGEILRIELPNAADHDDDD